MFYPNPTSGTIYIKDALQETIPLILNIFDSSGRLVDRIHQYSSEPLKINTATSGVIYFEIFDQSGNFIQKDVIFKQ